MKKIFSGFKDEQDGAIAIEAYALSTYICTVH